MQHLSPATCLLTTCLLLPIPAVGQSDNLLCDDAFALSATPQEIANAVASGADPNEMCLPDAGAFGPGRSTPLFGYTLACKFRMENCENWLDRMIAMLEAGADPNIPDDRGESLLAWTIILVHERAFDILLEFGADPNLSGGDALQMAAAGTFLSPAVLAYPDSGEGLRLSLSLISKLLAHGADPNLQDNKGETALHHAAHDARIEVIQALLAAGANPSLEDSKGETALHHAAYDAPIEVIQALLAAGADPNLEDNEGISPYELAKSRGRSYMFD